ncbi:MAG: hypothetical protein ABIA04_10340 [Pseudomonadota bacterium]
MKSNRQKIIVCIVFLITILFISGCAAGNAKFTTSNPAGFFMGLWHGIISVIAFVISLFSDSVRIYESNNTGSWYDFGFLLGVICVYGGGSHASCKQKKKKDKCSQEWDEIGEKIEKKIMTKLKGWAESDEDNNEELGEKEWKEIEKKLELKIKKKIKEWVE